MLSNLNQAIRSALNQCTPCRPATSPSKSNIQILESSRFFRRFHPDILCSAYKLMDLQSKLSSTSPSGPIAIQLRIQELTEFMHHLTATLRFLISLLKHCPIPTTKRELLLRNALSLVRYLNTELSQLASQLDSTTTALIYSKSQNTLQQLDEQSQELSSTISHVLTKRARYLHLLQPILPSETPSVSSETTSCQTCFNISSDSLESSERI